MAIPAMEPQLQAEPLDPPGEYQLPKWVPYYKTPEFSSWLSIANVSEPESQAYQDAVAALDAISGPTWSDEYHEERRIGTWGKPQLIGEYYLDHCKNHPIQDILQLWGYLPVFVPPPKGKGKSKPTTQEPSYRYAVGTLVMCNMARGLRSGTIIALS